MINGVLPILSGGHAHHGKVLRARQEMKVMR